ncbi:MAG: BspA family leucine-rich repeat surface protein [Lachnospiraceae bacterium]|nr:BspA family leucine-rich repeat surface protein [Lachnospiraceae bacterium]
MMKSIKYLVLCIMVLAVLFCIPAMDVSAEGTVRTGTLGTNNGVQWSYDESTKTMTITGEDSGLEQTKTSRDYGLIYEISSDVEKIILKDFKPVGSVYKLFAGLSKLKTIEMKNFNTSNVTSMSWMFYGCRSLTGLDVSGFDTSNVTSMSYMFRNCNKLTNLDVSGFDTGNVVYMNSMFEWCKSLTSLDVSGFDTGNVVDMNRMFSRCESLTNLNVSGFETAKVKNMTYMFDGCTGLTNLDLSDFDTSNVTSMEAMFQACSGLRSLDVSSFDTGNVVYMDSMFGGCRGLTGLDVRGFDTKNVKNMQYMFSNCSGLICLDLTGFDTKNVKNMNGMFYDCRSLTGLNISGFDTSNVTKMSSMFLNCESLESLDVSGFNTSKVTDMASLFSGLDKLVSLDVGNFDTSNVTDMGSMFYNSSSLRYLDVSNFDTSNVTDMNYMFCHDSSLRYLDVSSFDTSKVTDTKSMLSYCWALEEIHTPGTMATGQVIDLPLTLKDAVGQAVTEITPALCNKILYRYILGIGAKTTEVVVGESLQLTVKQNNNELAISDNTKYNWTSSSKSVATVSEKGVLKAVGAGTTTITVSVKDYGAVAGTITITVVPKVSIAKQPTSQTVTVGENAVFSVQAAGSGLSYRWQFRTSASGTWKNSGMTGANTNSITVQGTAARNGYQYRCVITDRGGNKVTSNGAALTVIPKLVITDQPKSQSVTEGDSAVFKVTATGSGLKYQWQFRTSASSIWKNSGMTGATTDSITVQGTTARNGYQYRCIVTDGTGKQVTSNAATLTVIPKLAITSQPKSQSVTEGDSAVFKVTATGNKLSYQWQFRTSASGTWKNSGMTGATTDSITVQGTTARNGYQYRCVITEVSGNKMTSNGATLTVVPLLVITSQPTNQSVTEGDSAVFKVTVTGNKLSYQWQFRKSATGAWTNSGMTGATTDSITVQGTTARNGYQYRCVITDGNGNKVTSNAATLTVVPKLVIISQPISRTVFEGFPAVFTVEAKGGNLSYQWQVKSPIDNEWKDAAMEGAGTNSITVQGTMARNGYQYRCVIADGKGDKVTSSPATLTVQYLIHIN